MENQAQSTQKNEETTYPFIVFKIEEGLYCVNSRDISTILQLPKYQNLPDAGPNVRGIFSHRSSVVELIDMRSVFGISTMDQEYEAFVQMIDARKEDHIRWVNELTRTIETGEKFTLATDPHKCAFGKWYDKYEFKADMASHHMRQIAEPHAKLHQAAEKAEQCARHCDVCEREVCLQDVLKQARDESMPLILRLLDETKEIFRSTAYREMVLLLTDEKWGIVVDEVLSVENLEAAPDQEALHTFPSGSLIQSIKMQENNATPIMEVNLASIFKPVEVSAEKSAL